ncbi:MAG: hypothetical protein M1840_007890 [Geoglossum simile]|nr:MAG: hypothetical protein M1840_007890 [Geoglossum simile]
MQIDVRRLRVDVVCGKRGLAKAALHNRLIREGGAAVEVGTAVRQRSGPANTASEVTALAASSSDNVCVLSPFFIARDGESAKRHTGPKEPPTLQMAAPVDRLIIALDYGTTFTGVAFHPVTGDQDHVNVDEIRILDQWHEDLSLKVPSAISFSPTVRWGFKVDPGASALVWTKLELEQQERRDELWMILTALVGMNDLDYSKIVESAGLPQYPTKDPVDIVAEYLSKVREYLVHTIQDEYSPEYLSTTIVDLVVTVPAVWTDAAKDRTFHAIHKAGFTTKKFKKLRDIILVTEPEAAAVYTLRSLLQHADEDFIGPGDCFVMCDAGGGTVDLISYRVRQLSPTLELEEVTVGTGMVFHSPCWRSTYSLQTGAQCGATFIDREFRRWLAKKLGAEEFQKLTGRLPGDDIGSHTFVEPRMIRVMKQFEGMKRTFGGSSAHDHDINLRGLVDPKNENLRISHLDFQKIFSKCVSRTIALIQGQIGLVQSKGLKYVFLSGGFGMSQYLQNEVEKFAGLIGIKLVTAAHTPSTDTYDPLTSSRPWVAVARGAIIRGLEKDKTNTIYMRRCRRHYGLSVSQPWSTFKHSDADAYEDPFDGERKAKNQMVWLIKKGDAILSSQPKQTSIGLCRRFGVNDPRVFRTTLVTSDDDEAPQRYDAINRSAPALHSLVMSPPTDRYHLDKLTETALHYDFTGVSGTSVRQFQAGTTGTPYLCVFFKIEITLEASVTCRVIFDEQEKGFGQINYV